MKSGIYRKGVFIVTYCKDKNDILYLILRRKKHWLGWEFPKGGAEKKETPKETAMRELKEETGKEAIKINSYGTTGKYKYDKKYPDRPGLIGQTYKLFSAEVKGKNVKIDKREHSTYVWLTFDKAWSKLTWPNQKICLNIVNKELMKKK